MNGDDGGCGEMVRDGSVYRSQGGSFLFYLVLT